MEELRKLLEAVKESNEKFVSTVINYVKEDEDERLKELVDFINETKDVSTSDILDFIDYDEEIDDEKPYTGEFKENVLEWLNGQKVITCTVSQKKLKNKLLKLAKEYPDDVKIENINDGVTILVKIPLKYLSIRKPRELSEEEKKKAAERLKAYRKNKKD